jgi:hypothetical protein
MRDAEGLYVDVPDAITLYSGGRIRPLDPDPNDIHIEDIAHALACQNRFTGHLRYPVSVAEHSLRVAALVPEGLKLEALLHDASEAYLSDIARPLKQAPVFGATYKRYESVLERAIAVRFNLPIRPFGEMHPEIKKADQLALNAEVKTFAHETFAREMGVLHIVFPPEAIPSTGSWEIVESMFLSAYRRYTEEGL